MIQIQNKRGWSKGLAADPHAVVLDFQKVTQGQKIWSPKEDLQQEILRDPALQTAANSVLTVAMSFAGALIQVFHSISGKCLN